MSILRRPKSFGHADVGLTDCYQQQFGDDNSAAHPKKDSGVAGVGPEISALIPSFNLLASHTLCL
jgi:hypothetical protein